MIGAGPVGLTLANYLGVYGIKTLLVEKNLSTVSEPRAVSIDDESMRAMQGIGLADEVYAETMPDYGSLYHSPSGKPFSFVHPRTREYGYPRRNAFHQWILERQLRKGLDRFAHVSQWFEHELVDFDDSEGEVVLSVLSADGKAKTVSVGYLAACDGGRSTVRTGLRIEMEGDSYEEPWLIIDLEGTQDSYRHTKVFCDPRRPGITLPGPGGARRFEFKMFEGEDPEEFASERNVRRLLASHGPDEHAKIRRRTIYTFHARMATRWKVGRVSLHGDAAHLSPPFAGQGMNSGIRDAVNYAWKLAAVARGELGESLLETYEQERRDHAWALIEMAVRMGRVMMPSSIAKAFLVQAGFRAIKLIPPLNDYITQMRYKPKPRFKQGFLVPDGRGEASIVGRLFPQPNVELPDRRVVKLDDALGPGFALISMSDRGFGLVPEAAFGSLPMRRIRVTSANADFPHSGDWVRDLDGTIEKALEAYSDCAVLIRPDRYVMAAITSSTDLVRLQELISWPPGH